MLLCEKLSGHRQMLKFGVRKAKEKALEEDMREFKVISATPKFSPHTNTFFRVLF